LDAVPVALRMSCLMMISLAGSSVNDFVSLVTSTANFAVLSRSSCGVMPARYCTALANPLGGPYAGETQRREPDVAKIDNR
jgi:hypothetical protein